MTDSEHTKNEKSGTTCCQGPFDWNAMKEMMKKFMGDEQGSVDMDRMMERVEEFFKGMKDPSSAGDFMKNMMNCCCSMTNKEERV